MAERPLGVTLIGLFYLAIGILGLVGPFLFLTVGLIADLPSAFFVIAVPFVGFSIIISVVWLALGYGMLELKYWAWLGVVILIGLSVASTFLRLALIASPGSFIGFLINLAILIYLMQGSVRNQFS